LRYDNILPGAWPRILALANTERDPISNHVNVKEVEHRLNPQEMGPCPGCHGPRDIIFFLLREKKDVLIPNKARREQWQAERERRGALAGRKRKRDEA